MAVEQLLDNLYLQPAPWRKWMQTREEIIQDWQAGKDFRIESGPYCSIRDIEYLRSSYNRIYIIHDRGTIEVQWGHGVTVASIDLKSIAEKRAGSNPAAPTKNKYDKNN